MNSFNPEDTEKEPMTAPSLQPLPRFELGRLVATPGALEVLARYHIDLRRLIERHVRGDWGDVCPEDARANEQALRHGSRLLSVYTLPAPSDLMETRSPAKVWIITEADRSLTTLILPEEN